MPVGKENMTASLRFRCVVGSLLALGLAASAQAVEVLSTARARMYRAASHEAWEAALRLAGDLKLGLERRDRQGQLFVTGWQRVAAYEGKGMSSKALENGQVPERFQLHVFVPASTEPARVYVDAILVTRPSGIGGGIHYVVYEVEDVSRWFLSKLEERLGEKGLPVPADQATRARQSHEMGGPEPCVPERLGGTIQEPKALYKHEPLFPNRDFDKRRAPTVVVEATVGEDGAVHQVRPVKGPQDSLTMASAANAVALWRYRPVLLGGCQVPLIMTVTVNFRSY